MKQMEKVTAITESGEEFVTIVEAGTYSVEEANKAHDALASKVGANHVALKAFPRVSSIKSREPWEV